VTRHIAFAHLHNLRDLGGYVAHDERTVRWGQLFRSDSLGKVRGQDRDRFAALGVRTVIDLRYPWETEANGPLPDDDNIAYHNFCIEHRPYDQPALDPGVDPVPFLAERYREVVHDGVKELRQSLEVIAAGDAPLVFHCTSGKDRTGIVAALVLSLLGVAESDIVADFALTGLATDGLRADWLAAHPGRTLRWPGYGQAPAALMERFLRDIASDHDSLRGYALDQLGIDAQLIDALQGRFLEP